MAEIWEVGIGRRLPVIALGRKEGSGCVAHQWCGESVDEGQ